MQPTAQALAAGMHHLGPLLDSITVGSTYEITLSSWGGGCYDISIGELTITVFFSEGLSKDHFEETLDWLSSHLEIELAGLPLHLKLDECQPDPTCTWNGSPTEQM
ncbi:hypothetical protein M407DRAFT_29328 [Tulasnella calospora MUT 4182]|uniref:Uncharacterized protein n=1 Tax=Tulasnella calospora MUT 4182 TaxID=1051891 RepID=A0A0C3LHU8_9AGAM|nr:hypothetical protein M407DRAFT_29328 [Tulasnella calospora MUT 4182]